MTQTVLDRMQAPGSKKILACDGGGILGLMSVEILAKLEYDLRVKLGKDDKFVLADYFDFVCGTSTGAIIAACIACGMSMDKIREFYLDSGEQMFDKASLLKRLRFNYNNEPLAKLLRKAFDEQLLESNATLGSSKLRTLLMMVLRNHSTDSPWPVSNNPLAKYNDLSRRDCNLFLPLWQLVRASSAAPTYFPPEVVTFAEGSPEEYNFIFVDGGVTTYNNPAYLAFQMATAAPYNINWPTGENQLLIVSVGTGGAAKTLAKNTGVDELNILHFAQNIPSALMNAASAGWDMTCRTLGACRHGGLIDREIGDMVQSPNTVNFSGPKLFSYLRYDPSVTREGLDALGLRDVDPAHVQSLDSVAHIGDIRRVGIEYANTHIKPEHFKGFV
ncbi:MAG: patatin-like phospholipase family protein [Methylomonas sp.]|jgi:patatin-like phospholipase/acyl hydrolase|uniref:patatin-like phospholipase family protein n=1 Tax=Methylomonas sp. TaxID=418 RepID=UPI0025E2EE3F|nr:patatin-like phospholipase family protein [Methylomonas sp.]MCK9605886.1 patatin-like phospholipase family protein [Methylomonas sp.]